MSKTEPRMNVGETRNRITAAAGRLLSGTSLFSSGGLNASSLSTEAGITRSLLYTDRYRDLLHAFLADANRAKASGRVPAVSCSEHAERIQALEEEVSLLRADVREARVERDAARRLADVYASRIAFLSERCRQLDQELGARAGVTDMRARRPRAR